MAVEVIDLTRSSPSLIVDDDDRRVPDVAKTAPHEVQKEKRKRKKKPKNKTSHEGDRGSDDKWRHDKYPDEGRHSRGEKRKRDDYVDDARQSRRRPRSPTPLVFTVDTTPSHIVGSSIPLPSPTDPQVSTSPVEQPGPAVDSLLLPAHVTMSTHEPVSIQEDTRSLSPVSDMSGIDFLDDDRAMGTPRYFDDRATNPKTRRFRAPCKNCGDDSHDLKNCTTIICLTCGVRDEHFARSCPMVRFCWNCQGKGHLSRDCPRPSNLDPHRHSRQDCERCGSWKHHGTNCPTIWRIYTYLTDAERDAVLADREQKRQLRFDEGGEGYIARDQWCYNCGECGHLGDDCQVSAPNTDKPNDYSAFGSYNQFAGPFAESSSAAPDVQRRPREWEQGDRFDDGYGFSAEANVGRKGRENAKAKAREAQRLLDAEEDEPDWFSQNRAATANGKGKAAMPQQPSYPKGLPPKPLPSATGVSSRNSGESRASWDSAATSSRRTPTAPRSLRDRIDMGDGRSSGGSRREHGERRRDRERRDKPSRQNSGQDRSKALDRDDRQRTRDERDGEHGSRWHGGYHR